MPNNAQAKKRLRQDVKRRQRNRVRKDACKSSRKTFVAAVESGDAAAAATALHECFSALDKAASKNTISKNKASRTKSRMAKQLAAMQ
jgi:small subunit ribosomal protein S20